MRVLIIGSEGFIGQSLLRRLRAGAPIGAAGEQASHLVRMDLRTAPVVPAGGATPEHRVDGDIADRAVLESAVADGIDCVFHLASVPGGAAERDFDLGMKVNLQSGISLLEVLRAAGNCPRLVFASTVGVYGVPMPDVIDEDTVPVPSLSYGAHKYVSEVLIADYSRRGFIDGRSLRIPGIVARPPTTGMLSIFLSDLIRNLSNGLSVICPVAADAPSWWMSRPCVVDNLLHAATLPVRTLEPQRSYLLPVQRLTMAEVVQAIADRCGNQILSRVSYQPDARLQEQFANYPPLSSPRAQAAGFRHDGDAAALVRRALED